MYFDYKPIRWKIKNNYIDRRQSLYYNAYSLYIRYGFIILQ